MRSNTHDKKHKQRNKRLEFVKRELVIPDFKNNEFIGEVTTIFSGNKIGVKDFYDRVYKNILVPGSFRNKKSSIKERIVIGNIVLIENHVDLSIIALKHIYTDDDIEQLRSRKLLNNKVETKNIVFTQNNIDVEDIDGEFMHDEMDDLLTNINKISTNEDAESPDINFDDI
jgi:hypothetical protein